LRLIRPLLCSGPADSRLRAAGFFTPHCLGVAGFISPNIRESSVDAPGQARSWSFSPLRSGHMPSRGGTPEVQRYWLPNITDAGLDHLIELLEKGSPLLIHGSFTRAVPMGCLATHVAWNHPRTAHLTMDAGICWLNHVAGLNPATSHVIRAWDGCGDS